MARNHAEIFQRNIGDGVDVQSVTIDIMTVDRFSETGLFVIAPKGVRHHMRVIFARVPMRFFIFNRLRNIRIDAGDCFLSLFFSHLTHSHCFMIAARRPDAQLIGGNRYAAAFSRFSSRRSVTSRSNFVQSQWLSI